MIHTPIFTKLIALERVEIFALKLTLLFVIGLLSSVYASAGESAGSIASVRTLAVEPFETRMAQAQPRPGKGGRPLREAVDACHSKQAGSECSFGGRNGATRDGSCEPAPDGGDGPLACRPAGNPPRS